MEYDVDQHLLLRDVAHQRCIQLDTEFNSYVKQVKDAGYEIFEVECPDWPPIKRTPLPIIIFSIGGEGGAIQGGPTADMTWEGTQLAIAKTWKSGKDTWRIAKEMAPDRKYPAHRVAYAWQVEEFDADKHVVIRFWCRDHDVSIVDFWREFYPAQEDNLEIISTTNPELSREAKPGKSYSPTRRSVSKAQLYLLRNHFLGTEEGPPDPEPKEDVYAAKPQPRVIHDTEEDQEEEVRWSIHEGVQFYPWTEVLQAMVETIGRDVRVFSKVGLDQEIAAITPEALARYLETNSVDNRQYIRDSGRRNYDCDDFALTLRSSLILEHGYNSCIMIVGDVHAFNAFVLASETGPSIVFVEPQTDGMVTELAGKYSVESRCEVLL